MTSKFTANTVNSDIGKMTFFYIWKETLFSKPMNLNVVFFAMTKVAV